MKERAFWVALRRALIVTIEAIEDRFDLPPYNRTRKSVK